MGGAALVVWVVCTAAVVARSRYSDDYTGVKMPQYDYDPSRDGPPPPPADTRRLANDDYVERSDDHIAAHLDYKIDEQPQRGKDTEHEIDIDDWKIPSKRTRRPLGTHRIEDDLDKFNAAHPKYRDKYRGKIRKVINKSDKELGIDQNRDEIYGDIGGNRKKSYAKDEMLDEYDFDIGSRRYVSKRTTERIIRRKPRNKLYPKSSDDLFDIPSNILRHIGATVSNSRRLGEVLSPYESARSTPIDDLDKELSELTAMGKSKKINNDYGDYYDMRRVNSIKNKIPSLLDRHSSKAHEEASSPEPTQDEWSEPSKPATPRRTRTFIKLLPPTPLETTGSTKSTTQDRPSSLETEPPNGPEEKEELSLAELSRQSILRKAQKKDSEKNDTTTKPPVLMQVTDMMHTIVVVEPPNKNAWQQRAIEIHEESPERLKLVKRLMRQNLVKNARSIQDLTDNWDEMVCDYIDTALLDNKAGMVRSKVMVITLVTGVLFFNYWSFWN